ncbi:MAG: nucleotidyltransferase family protein [Bacteroidota bacterium]
MNWLVLNDSISFQYAVKLLDQNGNGFLPVVDSEGKLVGVITDGDLRRGILNKKKDILDIINTKPVTMPAGTPHAIARRKLKEIHRLQMPLVDDQNILKEVVVLNDFEIKSKPNWVVIMAGGLGSRLGELTKNIPKPMLPVGGKPILEHLITGFKEFGFHKFIVCVNYKAELIKEFLGDGERLGVEIRYTIEEKRMGTAGPLSLIDFNLGPDFFVVNGDVLTTLNFEDFLAFHKSTESYATMCVKPYSYEVPFACIDSDARHNLVSIVEKPTFDYHINAGLYLLSSDILDFVPKNTFYDMPLLFEDVVKSNKNVKIFRMEEYWLDVGRPSDYHQGNHDMSL